MKTIDKCIIIIGSLSIVILTAMVLVGAGWFMINGIETAAERHEIREAERQEAISARETQKAQKEENMKPYIDFVRETEHGGGLAYWEDGYGRSGALHFQPELLTDDITFEYRNKNEYPLNDYSDKLHLELMNKLN